MEKKPRRVSLPPLSDGAKAGVKAPAEDAARMHARGKDPAGP